MAIREPSFTLGIEEEYLLVDKDSRDLAQEPPPALLAKCQEALLDYGSQVSPEFLRSQIEVGTSACHTIDEAREELIRLRTTVGTIADEFGLERALEGQRAVDDRLVRPLVTPPSDPSQRINP